MDSYQSNPNSIEWKSLSYSVRKRKYNWLKLNRLDENVHILKSGTTNYIQLNPPIFFINSNMHSNTVSGSVHSGQLVAVVGPSGAGKTTFLAAVSQRLRGRISGSLLLNGETVSRSEMAKRSSFVPQFDMTSETLTVFEHMSFVYELKNCYAFGQRKEYVSSTLEKLGLYKLSNSRILNLSGGERKKLALAAELLIDPSIIFCDEPTSGLDSSNALSVVSSLQKLVGNIKDKSHQNGRSNDIPTTFKNNKLVICSIHQPSSEVFACFSHIILMQDGQIAFQGTLRQAEFYFSRLGFKCSPFANRANFFVKTLMENVCVHEYRQTTGPKELHVAHSLSLGSSKIKCKNQHQIREVKWIYQILILAKRLGLENVRTIKELSFRLTTFAINAFLIAIVYSKTDDSNQKSIQDINGLIITLICQIVFTTAYNIVFYYPSKMPTLRRETGEKMYSLSAFYIAYLLCAIPKSMLECFLFLGIVFPFITFLHGFWMYLKIGFTLTMITIPATAYGLMLSGIFESSFLASSLAPPFDVTLILFGGVYIKLKTLGYLKYISLFFYASESISIIVWNETGSLNCTSQYYCLTSGEDVLKSMSFDATYNTIYIDYAGMMATAVVMNTIGFFGVRRMVNKTGYY